MSIRVKGSTTLAEVGTDGSLQTAGAPLEANAGFVNVAAQNDDGTVTGVKYNKAIEVDEDYRLVTGQDQLLFNETFVGTALNTTLWSSNVVTMTTAVASGFAQLNNGLSTATTTSAMIRSYRHFPVYKQATLRAEMQVQFSQLPQTNNVSEWGLFLASGSTAPTDGAFFRLNSTGQFYCVANYNGVEVQSTALNFSTLVGANSTKKFLIYVHSTAIAFWIEDILVAEINNPISSGSATSSNNLPLAFRTYNTAATTAAQVMKVGMVSVMIDGPVANKPWGYQIAGWGGHSSQGQTGGTIGSTSSLTNATTALTATVPSNTATIVTGLGGACLATVTTAINTPGILTSYQVPLGTAALPGRSLYITGVAVDAAINAALTTTLTAIFEMAVTYGHTAVSLATTETATTKAPRFLSLGVIGITSTNNVIGQSFRLQDDYTVCPLVIQPGEFIQMTIRNRFGTAPASGNINFLVTFTGFWE